MKDTKASRPRNVRRALAVAALAFFVLAFAFPERLGAPLSFAAKLQFGQATAALVSAGALYAVALFAAYAALTAVFGRFFCAFLCPLGAALDLAGALRMKARPRNYAYKPFRAWRIAAPALALALFWLGASLPFGTLEPYSVLASVSCLWEGPSLVLMAVLASGYFYGRGFCNSACPTGFLLSLFARIPGRRLAFTEKCLSCGRCGKACPASCCDPGKRAIDRARCVLCLECLAACPNGSLRYVPKEAAPEAGPVRRSFLRKAALGVLAGAAFATPEGARGRALPDPEPPPLLPPGALSLARLGAHCTHCHTCVRVCPNHAIAPMTEGGPGLWGKPAIDPYRGFCQYDCVECARACPAAALTDLDVVVKHHLRLGEVRLNRLECIVVKNGTSCGACAELCPTGAVDMGPGPSGRDEPLLEPRLCIGCGACQYACPVRPQSPIWVIGLKYQDSLGSTPPVSHAEDETLAEEFPF
ncbi:MAG: 4Fe-4S dicluster domain-containing protein [Deltaproteobacteria bacterium]|jgi:ferredoxin|nr:4Fe-4S dicluster domain-containing protein [Deltaproteobacteria bacterium]